MARNKKSSKAEGLITWIIFLVGALGAFYLFSGKGSTVANPGQSIEAPAEVAQLSQQEVYQ